MRIVGRVVVAESGGGIGDLWVLIVNQQGHAIAHGFTGIDGQFVFAWNVPLSGEHRIFVCLPDVRDIDQAIHSERLDVDDKDIEQDLKISSEALRSAGITTSLDWSIKTIEFSNGESIDLSGQSLTLLVGPNSSGKTRALRELAAESTWSQGERKVVKSVEMSTPTPGRWLIRNWIMDKYFIRELPGYAQAEFSSVGLPLNDFGYSYQTGAFLVYLLGIEERFQLSRYHSMSGIESPPQSVIDYIFRNDEIVQRLSDEVLDAFGVGLFPDFGPHIGFRVGDLSLKPIGDRASGTYRLAVQKFPKLEEAGDGLRSFVGTLIALEACPHPILLIDEPEAFLHPPQARILGRKLAEMSRERQIIIATHSSDIVLGALSVGQGGYSASPSVRIVRLQRQGKTNRASSLKPELLTKLTRDPQWESTELLQSMFHSGAVLCEADADRRFYRWLANDPEVAFVACNGKGGLAKAMGALRHLHVPVAVIADFDLLGKQSDLRVLIETAEGSVDALLGKGSKYAAIKNAMLETKEKTGTEIVSEMRKFVAEFEGVDDRSPIVQRLASLIESSKAGYEAKRYGIGKFSGGAHVSCRDFLNQLAKLGIFVVPHGELEGWWREGPSQKSQWIVKAWEKAKAEPTAFGPVKEFMNTVVEFLKTRNDR